MTDNPFIAHFTVLSTIQPARDSSDIEYGTKET